MKRNMWNTADSQSIPHKFSR